MTNTAITSAITAAITTAITMTAITEFRPDWDKLLKTAGLTAIVETRDGNLVPIRGELEANAVMFDGTSSWGVYMVLRIEGQLNLEELEEINQLLVDEEKSQERKFSLSWAKAQYREKNIPLWMVLWTYRGGKIPPTVRRTAIESLN